MRRKKSKHICAGVLGLVMFIIYFFGALDHISEESFSSGFDYPLHVNLKPLVEQIRIGIKPDVAPINYYDYTIEYPLKFKCPDKLKPRLVILVKSAMENFERRSAIRKTWGLEDRFENIPIRTVFFLGVREKPDEILQRRIDHELQTHRDIVQSKFIDSYYNNTIKTMMAFRWAYEYCPYSDFYLFSDDDMFISVKNLLKFIDDPAFYPKVRDKRSERDEKSDIVLAFDNDARKQRAIKASTNSSAVRRTLKVKEVDMKSLFAGFVFNSSPQRHRTSKWRISLEEYPWDMWPPYVTAGAYVISNEALKNIYAASLFVKHFRFDDIYLGIVALKFGIVPFHSDDFYFYKKAYSTENYNDLIASHGYDDSDEMKSVWAAQLIGGKV